MLNLSPRQRKWTAKWWPKAICSDSKWQKQIKDGHVGNVNFRGITRNEKLTKQEVRMRSDWWQMTPLDSQTCSKSRHRAGERHDVARFSLAVHKDLSASWDTLINGVGVGSVQSYLYYHFLLFNNFQQSPDLSPISVFKNTPHRLFACFCHVGDRRPPSEQHWRLVTNSAEVSSVRRFGARSNPGEKTQPTFSSLFGSPDRTNEAV